MNKTTLSLKVSKSFVAHFRQFCDAHAFSVGKFVEKQLTDVMEDFHFGTQTQRVLSQGDTRRLPFKDLLKRRK